MPNLSLNKYIMKVDGILDCQRLLSDWIAKTIIYLLFIENHLFLRDNMLIMVQGIYITSPPLDPLMISVSKNLILIINIDAL